MKAAHAQAIAAGWHAENFRRMGNGMKHLAHHLDPPSPSVAARQGGASVLAMMRRFAARSQTKD